MTPYDFQTGRGDPPDWENAFLAAMEAVDCRDERAKVEQLAEDWMRTIDDAAKSGAIAPRRANEYRGNVKVTLHFCRLGTAELAGTKPPAFEDFDNIPGTQ